ncbi:carboxylesterase family protein [Singulisphaera acidiphila]|nr:prolyl oligopeptidase family serine peptidase [Singulisphaera acidiphila]
MRSPLSSLTMILERPHRWPFVPTALGLLILAAGAADGHALAASSGDTDWFLLARAEVELYGGLWLLGGLSPQWTRRVALAVFLAVILTDITGVFTDSPTRYAWGRVAVGLWGILCGDLLVVSALLRWRPAPDQAAWVDIRPGRMAGTALLAVALGVAIDESRVGQNAIVVTAPSGGLSSGPGLDYLVYLPRGYKRSPERWPLILALHGAGAVGRDIDRVKAEGLPQRLERGGEIPFIVVAPLSPGRGWDVEGLNALLDEVLGQYRVDTDRVYLTGLSMGGYGTWALAAAHPERFAAIAPICGGGDIAWASSLRGVPTWGFHGAEDRIVPLAESQTMARALEAAGGEVRLTIYPGVGHDAWTTTYREPRLYDWFLAHRRRPRGFDGKTSANPTFTP